MPALHYDITLVEVECLYLTNIISSYRSAEALLQQFSGERNTSHSPRTDQGRNADVWISISAHQLETRRKKSTAVRQGRRNNSFLKHVHLILLI